MNCDVFGPIDPVSSRGYKYVLCIVDNYSRWIECIPLKGLTANETCNALISTFFRLGLPKILRHDNGNNFVAGLNKELYKRLGIEMRCSTPIHPECNGLVERANQTIKHMLHHVLNSDKPRDWDKKLQYLLWSYREVPNSTTNLSPYQMVYGRIGRGPLSVLQDTWTQEEKFENNRCKTNVNYFELLKKDLEMAAQLSGKHSEKAQDKYVKNYNKVAKEKEFKVGDLVLILIPDSTNKIMSKWIGPSVITAVVGENSYRIASDNGSVRVLHANKLRPYISRVQAVGIIFEDDEDFGEILCYPAEEDIGSSTKAIQDLDLSYLDAQKSDQLKKVLFKHTKVFSDKPGSCNIFEHEINLVEGFVPKRQRPYRIPEKLKAEVDRQIDQLLKDGKIRPSNSSFAHPVVCVVEPSGELRLCTDLRYVNSGTIDDCFPTPLTEDLILRISAANYISTLDNTAGYWQINLKETDRYKSAFATHRGLFEWTVLPFGAKFASQMFNRVVSTILAPHHEYADNYVDDSAVFSAGWKIHLVHLDAVLQAFEDTGMTLKLSKCNFAKPTVKFIGHEIGSGLRKPLLDKVEAIMKIEEPTTKKLLRSFLGCCAYYKSYIKEYSKLALILTELTKNKYSNIIRFSEEQSLAFKNLKLALCNYTTLHTPRYDRSFILRTDASDRSIGSVLSQLDDEGVERPIAFVSAKLTEAQCKMAVIHKEAYSLIYALKKLEVLVFASHIDVYIDHNPLTYLVSCLPQSAKLVRWALSLSRFDLTIRHVRGVENAVADCLSRC